MDKQNVLKEKSFEFAIRVVKLAQYLQNDKKEFILSKQIMRSGTAIGALISEAKFGQSDADFLSKMYIALKEANETIYWIKLLFMTEYINNQQFDSIHNDCNELLAMLISTTKTIKIKLNKLTNN